jgi:hypothetical protein
MRNPPIDKALEYSNRPRRKLSNLRIDEVSSVDRGAAIGARVVLTKRSDDMPDVFDSISKAMPGAITVALAKKLHDDASAGRISEMRFGQIQQEMAVSMFPNEPNVGSALAKFFQTVPGQATLAPRAKLSPEQNEALMKSESGDVASRRFRNMDGGGDSDVDAAKVLDELATSYAARDGISKSDAYTALLKTELGQKLIRADKLRSGLTV